MGEQHQRLAVGAEHGRQPGRVGALEAAVLAEAGVVHEQPRAAELERAGGERLGRALGR